MTFNASRHVGEPAAHPPMTGFLAAVFRAYPQDIDAMIPDSLDPRLVATVATALRLAGQEERARTMGKPVSPPLNLDIVPDSLDAVTARNPTAFDVLWGASFATGDPRYCRKIVEHFAAVANTGDRAGDVVTVARSIGQSADLHWLGEKYGRDEVMGIVHAAVALWGLNSNARQHEFVRTVLDAYIAAHPGEPAAKALLAVR